MQKFDYRAPRFHVDYPVQLTLEDAAISARCKEISAEGMRVHVDAQLPQDALAVVTISFESVTAELPVRVIRSESNDAGLRFIYKSDRQRRDLERVVTLLTATSGLAVHPSVI